MIFEDEFEKEGGGKGNAVDAFYNNGWCQILQMMISEIQADKQLAN